MEETIDEDLADYPLFGIYLRSVALHIERISRKDRRPKPWLRLLYRQVILLEIIWEAATELGNNAQAAPNDLAAQAVPPPLPQPSQRPAPPSSDDEADEFEQVVLPIRSQPRRDRFSGVVQPPPRQNESSSDDDDEEQSNSIQRQNLERLRREYPEVFRLHDERHRQARQQNQQDRVHARHQQQLERQRQAHNQDEALAFQDQDDLVQLHRDDDDRRQEEEEEAADSDSSGSYIVIDIDELAAHLDQLEQEQQLEDDLDR